MIPLAFISSIFILVIQSHRTYHYRNQLHCRTRLMISMMISSDTFFGGIKESTFLGVVPPRLCVQNTETNVHIHIESYITSHISLFHQRLNFYLTSKLNFADSSYWTYLTFSYWNFRHFMDFPLSAIFFLIFYWHFFWTNFQVFVCFFSCFPSWCVVCTI